MKQQFIRPFGVTEPEGSEAVREDVRTRLLALRHDCRLALATRLQ